MLQPTIITWILVIFSAVTFLPLLFAQLIMIFKPQSRQAKDILIGKGEDWRDKTHYKSALAFAWADWIVIMPLLVFANIGVILGELWGYILWAALGAVSIYFSIVFWIMEKEYTYPSCGPLAYYTYFWGFFLYWGIAVFVYSILRLAG